MTKKSSGGVESSSKIETIFIDLREKNWPGVFGGTERSESQAAIEDRELFGWSNAAEKRVFATTH